MSKIPGRDLKLKAVKIRDEKRTADRGRRFLSAHGQPFFHPRVRGVKRVRRQVSRLRVGAAGGMSPPCGANSHSRPTA